jgi:hypothetical protein
MQSADSSSLYLDVSASSGLSALQTAFLSHGCFVARGLLAASDLVAIQQELRRLIGYMREKAGLPRMDDLDAPFDAGMDALFERNPALVETVVAAARRLTSVHLLSVNARLLELSRLLMDTDMVMSSPYKPVRVDHASRKHVLLPWHQDYPYAQDSIDSVVYWIPLQAVDTHNGCLRVAPGSHRLGVLPVVMLLPPPGVHQGIKGIALANPELAERQPSVELPMQFGDVLGMSSLLLHRSQPNHSNRARWTCQVRHGNFANPDAIRRSWPRGHYERHWFDETHPEWVVPPPAELEP